jgi:hypothetical protein
MEILSRFLSVVVGGTLSWFGGHHAMLSLLPLSVLTGAAMLWTFARTSDQAGIRKIKQRLSAYLYEMRLFTDEPLLIWKAQCGLLVSNVRYLSKMLFPALILSVPMLLIFPEIESFYGYHPLAPGREAVVTMQMKDQGRGQVPLLRAPEGIEVESPPVSVEGGRQLSWRIRALHPVTGTLDFVFPTQTISKSVQAGSAPQYLSERRVSSLFDLLRYPAEPRLHADSVDWIQIRYSKATVHALGLDLHWVVWLVILSMISALFLKGRFKVSF